MEQTQAIVAYSPRSLDELERLSAKLSKSSMIPAVLRGKAEDVMVIVQAGMELGLYPMQALRGMYVLDGKPIMGSDLIVALVQRHRDVCQYFRLVESTPQKAIYETLRKGAPGPSKLTWTIQQATTAGLTGKDNWRKYPDAMLRHRCATALARAVYPDLALGIYCEDEGEEISRGMREVNPPPPVQVFHVEPHVEPVEAELAPPEPPPPGDDFGWGPPVGETKAEASSGDGVVIVVPFGKNAGKKLSELTQRQLTAYVELAEKNVSNPDYKYDKAKEQTWLLALKSELGRRESVNA